MRPLARRAGAGSRADLAQLVSAPPRAGCNRDGSCASSVVVLVTSTPHALAPDLRRLVLVLAVLTAVVNLVFGVATTRPAAAHPATEFAPSNYQTRITSVAPAIAGLTMGAVDHGDQLALTNATGRDIVVLGYAAEPYLRVGSRGVFTNQRSPATFLNRDRFPTVQIPPQVNPKAAPIWRRVGGGQRVTWHDHRAHWMGTSDPPTVQAAPWRLHVINPRWRVELRDGGRRIIVTGDLRWVPTPVPADDPNSRRWPWLVGVAACLLGIVVGLRRRLASRYAGARRSLAQIPRSSRTSWFLRRNRKARARPARR
jgi:hypothetical protein